METACIFCEKLQNKNYVIENGLAFAFWDQYPVNEGHMLICPKRHIQSFFDLSLPELAAIYELMHEAKMFLKFSYCADGYNIGVNVGQYAGQTVNHAHVHLIPRYKGDVENPRGGVRNFKESLVPYDI